MGASNERVMMMRYLRGLLCVLCLGVLGARLATAEDARELVRRAVQSEMRATKEDHSRWRYLDDERVKGTLSIVVETDAGVVKRLIARNGHPLSEPEARLEEGRVQAFVHDPARLEKQRKDGESDDRSAAELLGMLPNAFTWRVAAENAEDIDLAFQPDPDFHPPDMQSKVLGAMAGDLVVNKRQLRIKTIRGRLTQDVMLGFGILGRMKAGGTFDVERREVKPGFWQITQTHVHIDGKALFFKSIGQQQDEIETDFVQVPGGTTLEQAAEMSKPGWKP